MFFFGRVDVTASESAFMKPAGDVLNTVQAAAFLGAHVETVRRLARRGDIPSFKVGRDWRFMRQALSDWSTQYGRPDSGQPTVLVVDDEPLYCTMLARMLELAGYRALRAAGGEDGLASIERERVDLVLLDLMMPGVNGPAFLRALRAANQDLPVIVMTGYPDSSLMVEAMRYGPLMVLAKPIDRDMLLRSVRCVLPGFGANLHEQGESNGS